MFPMMTFISALFLGGYKILNSVSFSFGCSSFADTLRTHPCRPHLNCSTEAERCSPSISPGFSGGGADILLLEDRRRASLLERWGHSKPEWVTALRISGVPALPIPGLWVKNVTEAPDNRVWKKRCSQVSDTRANQTQKHRAGAWR